ncbi:guanine deaminase [Lentilactobacillus kefiri]|uniref:Guanine deaminase n=2 Tax=Lentilactobacillus kefiri TaxID=33962 RepID=A0A8E1RHY5_LENKE|nr:guanine deaminase [Lentilactobacillus parakefiri DSM 10551]KRM50614.1 guanine deaminase [Lentilactobacillus kefiri DSM 20587 = JCM 5818]PAK58598.1 guanine deaminase [Lentilactobacillus kefiri]PAK81052.1 guanine deaminase [Lentilactobacillus kefiri]PAL05338.1 guanine deaminase [Lentilactobacillus kefiri]
MIIIATVKVIEGPTITSTDPSSIQCRKHQLTCIDGEGYIERIVDESDDDFESVRQHAKQTDQLLTLRPDEYLLPGFIDLHVHAPQWPNAGVALDRPLNEWLDTYTFPLESKYQDVDFAKPVYDDLVKQLLANGTTTVLYFGTTHNPANLELAKACIRHNQRGFVGKVAMDNPDQTPEYYRDASASQAVEDTETFIKQMIELNKTTSLKQTPVITPRFVPSCTPESLKGLGELAWKYDLPVQSHCSESDWENGYALEHYHKRDAEVLDEFGLLTDKSVMAHGTLLNQTDLNRFKDRGVAIAHCPISNVYFGNAVLPVSKLLKQKVKVGLGTDISGGYSPSLYQNIRQAVMSSRMLHDGVNSELDPAQRGTANDPISAKNGFYLATVGGAESLHLRTGQIKPGYLADLQVVQAPMPSFNEETMDQIFEKIIYNASKDDVKQVFVQGRFAK